jgi:streptomycin 6-kinase
VSEAQAALERVRVMATLWAATEGDGLSIALDRRVGEAVLSTIREDGSTAESRLGRVTRLAGGWTTPGNTLYYPAAGQAVLDVIAGDGTAFPVADDPRAVLAEMAERERLVAIGYVRDPKDVPRLLAAVEAVLALHKPEPYYQALLCSCRPKYVGRLPWPCPTVQAIARELTGKASDA